MLAPAARTSSVKAIDLFAGGGGFSTGARMAGVPVVWAANHWPLAVDYHERNHPQAEHKCQDLHQADWAAVPYNNVLLASPACIPLDSEVVMGDGSYKQAGDLVVGETVLTHLGRAKPIVEIWKKHFTGRMIDLTMWGDTKEPARMTADHRVWVRRRACRNSPLGEPQFLRADQVLPSDYVAFPTRRACPTSAETFLSRSEPPRLHYEVEAPTPVQAYEKQSGLEVVAAVRRPHRRSLPGAKVALRSTPDLWWLVGHYLGDGQVRRDRHQVGWSTGGSVENADRVRSILLSLGLSNWTRGPSSNQTVFAQSKQLHGLLSMFGTSCYTKHIPNEVLEFPRAEQVALLSGYLAADGHLRLDRSNPLWRASSVSLALLQGLQRVAWQLGWSAGISTGRAAGSAVIEGRRVQTKACWELFVQLSPHKQSRTKFDGAHVWRSVRSVRSVEAVAEPVVDFEVADDHTFCLPSGVVVHNCTGHSPARGKDRPQHDIHRSTAWAVVSCAEYHRQDICVVENVPAFEKWALYPSWIDAMRRLGYAVSPHIIDAADHGVPQNRERLFLVCTRSKAPLQLRLPKRDHVPIGRHIDWNSSKFRPIYRPGRSKKTLSRVASGRERFGDRFLAPYYGSGSGETGRSIHRPVGTITTRDRWAVIDGDRMRMLSKEEAKIAMGFPLDYLLPKQHKPSIHLLGNAVCPPVVRDILLAIFEQA